MKIFTFNIITSWSEVSLELFDQISQITGEPYEQVPKLLSILSSASEEEIRSISVTDFEHAGIPEKLAFLSTAPKKRMPSEKLTLGGRKFTVSLYPNKWTAGQYLDYTSVMGSDTDRKLAKLIACFCVPEGHKYGDGYDFDELVNFLYKNMSIETALGYAGFFQLQLTAFGKALRACSERRRRRSTRRLGNLLKRKPQAGSTSSGTTLS